MLRPLLPGRSTTTGVSAGGLFTTVPGVHRVEREPEVVNNPWGSATPGRL
ncbi:hypothetical protein [Kibdelosporangium persicum]|nr:hypothetical protein [Kibdelosporangium persicum]